MEMRWSSRSKIRRTGAFVK